MYLVCKKENAMSTSIAGMALLSFLEAPKYAPSVRCKVLNSAGAEALGSDERLSRTNVQLYDETFHEAITHWDSVRAYNYSVTYSLPDGIRGERILPKEMLDSWWKYMEKAQARGIDIINDLAPTMPHLDDRLRDRLQPIVYDQIKNKIPTEKDILRKWRIGFKVKPIADSSSIIFKWESDCVDRMKKQVEENNKEILVHTHKAAYEKLYDVVSWFSDMTSQEKSSKIGMFEDKSLEKLRDIAELMPRMNVTGDAVLNEIAKATMDRLSGFTISDLKDDEELRETKHDESMLIARAIQTVVGEVGS